jgi:hypothetical protein
MKQNLAKEIWMSLVNRWRKMLARCQDKTNDDYVNYGARGIEVWAGWRDPISGMHAFVDYVANSLPRPDGMTLAMVVATNGVKRLSIDRIDNDRGYEPGNLRWASPEQQSQNQRRTVFVDVNGERLPRTKAARQFGVDSRTASRRENLGYSSLEAVTLPVGGKTADSRRYRDQIILEMIRAGDLLVDSDGFIFVADEYGWHLAPLGTSRSGHYLGVSITVPKRLHAFIPGKDLPATGAYRSMFQHSRVVALAHHPLPADLSYYEADHINMKTRDNRPGNLRWQRPQDHRADAHRGREGISGSAISYGDPKLQEAALRRLVKVRALRMAPTVETDEPGLPPNLSDSRVDELLVAVTADADFAGSTWANGQYFTLLRSVLAASGNNCVYTAGRVTIECMGQTSTEVIRVFVTALTTASRVFQSCVRCGRQSYAVRTEIRNRLRYPNTPCESCQALDVLRPDLAALVARDPATGFKRHPSRISVGSNQCCHFHCRTEGCPTIVERKVKTLARDGVLPTCEAHRRRGANFGGVGEA